MPAFSQDSAEFSFDVRVLKNTCHILIEGDAPNLVDFGILHTSKLKDDAKNGLVKKPFTVKLERCKNNDFTGSYIEISGNFVNDGFLDDPGNKDFAVRISDKNNAKQSDKVFFSNEVPNNKMWSDFTGNSLSKTFYTYIMCKNGISDCSATVDNIGDFKATITLTYMAD